MAKCQHCGGRGMLPKPCPDNIPGCCVLHVRPCTYCHGTGKADAPAPATASAADELAAKLLAMAAQEWFMPEPPVTLREAAALLTQQAAQLQRQAAVIEAARAMVRNVKAGGWTPGRLEAYAALEAALAAYDKEAK